MRFYAILGIILLLSACTSPMSTTDIRKAEEACLNSGGMAVTMANGVTGKVSDVTCTYGDHQ